MALKKIDIVNAHNLFYPFIPVVVTAEHDGRVAGMLAAWWLQLSHKPLLLGVAVAPERFTYKVLLKAEGFALNFLDFKLVDKTPYLGDVSERFYRDKIRRGGFTIVEGDVLGAPYIAESSAAVELRKVDRVVTGDHDLFIGEVVSAYANDAFVNGRWDYKKYSPLMYLGRTKRPQRVYRYYATAEDLSIKPVEYASGIFRESAILRHRVLDEFRRMARELGEASLDEAIEAFSAIAEKFSLDNDDIKMYIEELIRSGDIRIKED